MQGSQTLKIIRVKFEGDTKGVDAIAKGVAGLNQQLKSVSGAVNLFKNAFAAIAGASFLGVGIAQVTQLADSYSLLTDKLKVLTGSGAGAEQAFAGIQKLAIDNKSSIESVGTVYARLSQSLSDVGATSDQVLKISDLLIKSFRISGATVAEATAGTIQLSQGLATGAIRGQELRSVLESNVVIGSLLAKNLGVTRGELLKLGEQGKITAEVFLKSLYQSEQLLTDQSNTLGITFEQLGIKIKDKLLVFVGKLSKDFDVTGKLAVGVDYLINKLPALAASIATLGAGILVLSSSSVLGTTVNLLIKLSAILTPIRIIIAAVATGVFFLVDNFEKIGPAVDNALVSLEKLYLTFKLFTLQKIDTKTFGIFDSVKEEIDKTKNLLGQFAKENSAKEPDFYQRSRDFKTDSGIPDFKKTGQSVVKLKDILAALNKEYNSGKITLQEYYGKLSNFELTKLNKEMREGKINLEQYNEKVKELSRNDMQRLFETGAISLKTFNDSINSDKMEDLNNKFKQGKINVEEYNRSLIALSDNFNGESALVVGTSDFLQRIGTVSQNVASAITETFGRLEDSLLDFIKTGKFSFKEFSMAIIEDINRIILRALIIRPLAQGILGSIGGSSAAVPDGTSFDYGSAPNSALAANGFAPRGSGVSMFAQGGIVNGATPFTYGGNKKGIMGEAGPEAIMPLKRAADGSLGVKAEGMGGSNVTVNIINQAGAEVQQQESTGPDGQRILDVLIMTKVKEGLARGDLDRTFQQSYGLRRRGN